MSHINVTASDVQDLLDTDLTVSEIQPFLAAAKRYVADNLEGEGVAGATLTEIEKYLASGIVSASRDPTASSVSLGDASITYQRGGDHPEHIKVAAMLDPTGSIEADFMGGSDFSFRVGAGYDDDLDLAVSG